MTATVNGVEWSRADLDGLWWSFAEMLVYASEAAPVRRGDVLGSGTCGTGCILELSLVHGADKYPYLQPGDEVELEVAGLGVLANRVVAADAPGSSPTPTACARGWASERPPKGAGSGEPQGVPRTIGTWSGGCWRRPGGSGPAPWSCPTTP